MARIEQISCDKCGTLKGATNHWYKLLVNRDGFAVVPLESNIGLASIPSAFNPYVLDVTEYHLCGQACAIAKVSELLGR